LQLEAHREIETAFTRKRWPSLGVAADGGKKGLGAARVPVKAGDDGR